MIPVIPTIALAFLSFICSAFVILRIIIPILPPHPLSRRVSPSEFGLPNFNFRSLSAADKSHLWLASLDLIALSVFIWQAATEYFGGPSNFGEAQSPAAAARLWFAMTIRQTCLLVLAGIMLVHVRMGRSVAYGKGQWSIWAPTLFLGVVSTATAGVLAATGAHSFFIGLVAYSGVVAALTTVAFAGLAATLFVIKRNLTALNEPTDDAWPHVKGTQKRFATPSIAAPSDVDALKEGSSWITSDGGDDSSRHDSVSAWSFSTQGAAHHRRASSTCLVSSTNALASTNSLAPKSQFWFSAPTPTGTRRDTLAPPVPPLPASLRASTVMSCATVGDEHPDPFRREGPNEHRELRSRLTLGSENSWLSTENNQSTVSAWSLPESRAGSAVDLHSQAGLVSSRSAPPTRPSSPTPPSPTPSTPGSDIAPQALATAQVLGGYGFSVDSEKGLSSLAVPNTEVDISPWRFAAWIASVWVPVILSFPYLVAVASPGSTVSAALPIFMVISATISSPLLATNVIFSPIPIPVGLFDAHIQDSASRAPTPASTNTLISSRYKRSASTTVVDDRRSGDVWLAKGDAVDRRNKLGRAMGMIEPLPRLSVMPPQEDPEPRSPLTPPLPMQDPDMEPSFPSTYLNSFPAGMDEVGVGRMRRESEMSEEVFDDSRIMVARRFSAAVAQCINLPPSPSAEGNASPSLSLSPAYAASLAVPDAVAAATSSGVDSHAAKRSNRNSHLRVRSAGSARDMVRVLAASAATTPIMACDFMKASTSTSDTGASASASSSSPNVSIISRPPTTPLPPTPPSVRAAKARSQGLGIRLVHRKSRSDLNLSYSPVMPEGFSFGAVDNDDTNAIDELSAGMLPILVPGLKVGKDVKVKEFDFAFEPQRSSTVAKKRASKKQGHQRTQAAVVRRAKVIDGSGDEFAAAVGKGGFKEDAPLAQSTPPEMQRRARKVSTGTVHSRHASLPSLTMCDDWLEELQQQLTGPPPSKDDGLGHLRNTVWGDETHANVRARSEGLAEQHYEPSSAAPGATVTRNFSTRTLGLRPEVPHSVRGSFFSISDSEQAAGSRTLVPSSATGSAVTLFEPDASFAPPAESTPLQTQKDKHESVSASLKKHRDNIRNRIVERTKTVTTTTTRRSSIKYIKSDSEEERAGSDDKRVVDNYVLSLSPETKVKPAGAKSSTSSTLAQWSPKAVRPLVPRASKRGSQQSSLLSNSAIANSSSTPEVTSSQAQASDSPKLGGLRQLSLLQDRTGSASSRSSGARALVLGRKKSKKDVSSTSTPSDENSNPNSSSGTPASSTSSRRSLKPLSLYRSGTAKERARLRQNEVLPAIAVRPPSGVTMDEGCGFAF
ncbi:hypothetical protein CONPUDRAFT_168889 [Coniophora puteana RWD-64-598 SS2]|uniref:Uncharacterized protein n=1 Tax=Coniophora puteana (strain RWD-64-598) TaxID=741705 RepID=A0A5M3MBA0_CONPW|nr:uncharacterized protein CONPUDRAFT_168889 [Coniophora puteana RWD-64-598 SS2]EIW76327.1 hypothetical protein CONPUDRAFT_168889 [Coniophora puteana RWD-64-598 SS2]